MTSRLPERWRTDPMVRCEQPRWHEPRIVATQEALVASFLTRHGVRAGFGIGSPGACADLAQHHLTQTHSVVSMPAGTWELMPSGSSLRTELGCSSRWDWMLTHESRGPAGAPERVREADLGRERAAYERLQSVALPDSYTSLDLSEHRWFGWYDVAGVLRAMAGAGGWHHEVHLGSIAVDPRWRGRGIGTALVAHLTALGLARTGQVSLGVYTENVRAIALYERLGFHRHYAADTRRPPARA